MPVSLLPANPSLRHLKCQAKDLLKEHAVRDLGAAQRIREFHPRFNGATDDEIFAADLRLSDAQATIAREYGFSSWMGLKRRVEKPRISDRLDLPHHERIEDPAFRRAVELLDAGDAAGLREQLRRHPKLVRQRIVFEGENYFRNPALLEFIAENPVRRGTLPKNIVEIAQVILDAGVEQSAVSETLGLVATGRVPRECGLQLELVDLLCKRGANPTSVIEAAACHGESEAVSALIGHGARINLSVAAALGRIEDFHRLLPTANGRERHLALALASQFGHVEIVRMLLDTGEDPNRYNPVGAHSHSTPLHQAAWAGHLEVVKLLIERGARLDLKDIMWQGTAADWARHADRAEVEAFLRAQEREQRTQ